MINNADGSSSADGQNNDGSNSPLSGPSNETHHERQTLLLMLLAQVCSLHDATPRTFVVHVLALFERGILDDNSIRFLFDLGLVPKLESDSLDEVNGSSAEHENSEHSQNMQPTADVLNTYFNSSNPLAIVPYNPQRNHPWSQDLPRQSNYASQESIIRQREVTAIKRHLERQESSSATFRRGSDSLSSQSTSAFKPKPETNSQSTYESYNNTLSNLPAPWSVEHHPLTLSRYQRDFHQISLLATGSFGSVYHSIHKLENKPYAVKCVTFSNSGYLSSMLALVVREVRCLALLNHPNCVRYYTSWLEPSWMTGDQNLNKSTIDDDYFQSNTNQKPKLLTDIEQVVNGIHKSDEIDDTVEKLEALLYGRDDGFDWASNSKKSQLDAMTFEGRNEDSDVSEWTRELDADESHGSYWDSKHSSFDNARERSESFHEVHSSMHGYARQESLELVKADKKQPTKPPKLNQRTATPTSSYKYQICLFIQMQLCRPTTLADWIKLRNNSCVRFDAEEKHKRAHPAFIIFRQIVDGLVHVHDKGIIHRDLKPANIFAGEDGHWLIGDFGLSKIMRDAQPMSPNSNEYYPSGNFTDGHTAGVGTASYAAPEQITENDYGSEVDIFALGIILLELFSNFTSEHERAKAFYNLRHQRELAQWMHRTYPEVSQLVLDCTQTDCRKRPTATDIRNVFHESNCTELYRAEVTALKDEIDMRDTVIDMQNNLLKEKDREIEVLRQRLSRMEGDAVESTDVLDTQVQIHGYDDNTQIQTQKVQECVSHSSSNDDDDY